VADTPSGQKNNSEPPAPEVLKAQDDETPAEQTTPSQSATPSPEQKPGKRPRHGTYRPSHRATFIGLAVAAAILLVNGGIIAFVLRAQKHQSDQIQGQVTINQSALDKLGVSRNQIGDTGVVLTVNPDADFKGKLQVGGNVDIAGQLNLNNKVTAPDASLAKLEAGDTSLNSLNVNGDGTFSNLSLRSNLAVTGTTQLQGAVTVNQLFTVNNSVNVAGNLSVGGTLAVGAFQVANLSLAGHVTTLGSAPSVSKGSALGSLGTVSISGNDAAGTVAANAGVGAGSGQVACVSFRNAYSTTPHVVVTASGPVDAYVSRNASGFCIYAGNSLIVGSGYAFDYIVEQ